MTHRTGLVIECWVKNWEGPPFGVSCGMPKFVVDHGGLAITQPLRKEGGVTRHDFLDSLLVSGLPCGNGCVGGRCVGRWHLLQVLGRANRRLRTESKQSAFAP